MSTWAAISDVDVINQRFKGRIEFGEAVFVEADGGLPFGDGLTSAVPSQIRDGGGGLAGALERQDPPILGEARLAPVLDGGQPVLRTRGWRPRPNSKSGARE
jgi:hypothetical protein